MIELIIRKLKGNAVIMFNTFNATNTFMDQSLHVFLFILVTHLYSDWPLTLS